MAKTKDSILAHCIARAVIAEQGGIEAATAKYGEKAERLSKWEALKTAARVTPKASRVATFIVFWTVAMRVEGLDEFSITEYQRYWSENERQAYRLQKEFRELWPELDTPNELARQMVSYLDERDARKNASRLTSRLQVVA